MCLVSKSLRVAQGGCTKRGVHRVEKREETVTRHGCIGEGSNQAWKSVREHSLCAEAGF